MFCECGEVSRERFVDVVCSKHMQQGKIAVFCECGEVSRERFVDVVCSKHMQQGKIAVFCECGEVSRDRIVGAVCSKHKCGHRDNHRHTLTLTFVMNSECLV